MTGREIMKENLGRNNGECNGEIKNKRGRKEKLQIVKGEKKKKNEQGDTLALIQSRSCGL